MPIIVIMINWKDISMAGIIVLAIIFNTCKKNNLFASEKKSNELKVGTSLKPRTHIIISENKNHKQQP